MRVNANAVLRSWTLLATFGGSYAPDSMYTACIHVCIYHFSEQCMMLEIRRQGLPCTWPAVLLEWGLEMQVYTFRKYS